VAALRERAPRAGGRPAAGRCRVSVRTERWRPARLRPGQRADPHRALRPWRHPLARPRPRL